MNYETKNKFKITSRGYDWATGNYKEESEQLLHEFKYFDENCDNKLTTLLEKHVLQEHQYVLSWL